MDLSVTLGRLRLANPILVASGTFGYAKEMAGIVDSPGSALVNSGQTISMVQVKDPMGYQAVRVERALKWTFSGWKTTSSSHGLPPVSSLGLIG